MEANTNQYAGNRRIPELDELLRNMRPDDQLAIYDPITDKTYRIPGHRIVAGELAREELYLLLHYPAGVDGANPYWIVDPYVMVYRNGGVYRLAYPGRPYGSTDFEGELASGHWELVAGGDVRITDEQIANWDTAFGWGDHAQAGYLTEAPAHALGGHTDTEFTNLQVGQIPKWNGTKWVNAADDNDGSGSSAEELDPVFSASPAGSITSQQKTNWDAAFGWGDHAAAGYLTGFTESDPVFAASPAYGVTSANITNWNSAYGWGNHATQGYLKSFTETDPVFNASAAKNITATNITNWNSAFTNSHTHANKATLDGITATNVTNWNSAYGWGNHAGLYLAAGHAASGVTAQKITNWDAAFASSHSHSNKTVLDGITSTKVSNWDAAYADRHTHANKAVLDGITATNVSNWNSAYGWGNHAAAGYLTALPAHTLTSHSDVTINTPAPNQVLYYNGSAWVNGITPGLGDYLPKNLTANTQLYLANRSFTIGSAGGGIMEMAGQGLDITALYASYKGYELATVNDLGGTGGPHAITAHTDFVGAAPENGESLVWTVDGVNNGFRAAAPTREAYPSWYGASGGVADFSEKITQPVTAITEGGTLWVNLPLDKAASFGVPIYVYNNGEGVVEFDQPVQMGGTQASSISQLGPKQAIKIVSYGSWFQGYLLRGMTGSGGATQTMSNNRLAGSLTSLIDSTNGTVTTGVFKEDIFQESGSISFGESTANDLKAGSRMFSDFNSTQLIDGATLNVGAQGSTGSGGDKSGGALYGYMGNYAHFKTAASQSKNVDSRVQLDGTAQASQAAVKLESQYSITNITGKTNGIRRSTFEAFANGDIEPEARITLYRGNTQGMQYNAQYQFRNTGIYLNGSLLISPSGDVSMALGDLTNVSTVGATNGQALVFNGSSWAPGTVSGGGDGHAHANMAVLDGITAAKVTNWDAAYGWGNHASAGYLTSVPLFGRAVNGLVPQPGGATSTRFLREDGTWVVPTDTNTTYSVITDANLANTASTTGGLITGQRISTWANSRGLTTAAVANWDSAYGWGNHAAAGYVPGTRTVAGKALSADITLVKADVGLGSVDNTSDATKNAATATLTNKTISGASNTLSNIPQSAVANLATDLSGKQATLVSGTNIKTVNGQSLLGSGDLVISGGTTAVATSSTDGLMSAADKAKFDAQVKTMAPQTLSDASTTSMNVADHYNFAWSPATAARTLLPQNFADGSSWAVDILTCNGQTLTFGPTSGYTHRLAGTAGTVTGVTLPTGGKVITLLGRRRGTAIMWAILEY